MKKQLIKVLLCGAVAIVSASMFTSCNNEAIDDLNTRVTVLEGMVRQLESDLQAAMVTGSTITSATKDANGVWTIVLSDGKTINIDPSTGGGSVEIEETADAFVFTVNGNTYAIPKNSSAAVNSLVYVPEYEDGKAILGADGVVVKFLATPALSADVLAEATFDIADAREVLTRAGAGLFKVESAAVDGDLLSVVIKGLSCEAKKVYTVALKAVIKGAAISSNYFTIEVSKDFNFDPEVLEAPVMKDGVQLSDLTGDGMAGFHRVLIQNSAIQFIQGFNLKDQFQALPAGNVSFQLAPAEEQNDNVKSHYDIISEALSADGTWSLKRRLGTDCWNSEGKNGILIYTVSDDVIKHKIFWQIDNPIPGMGGKFDSFLNVGGEQFPDGQHIEFGSEPSVNAKWMVPAGAGTYDLAKIFLTATFPEGELLPEQIYLRHGNANKALQMIQAAEMLDGEGDTMIGNDGSSFYLGDYFKQFVKYSRGLVWRTTQPSWASSIRENWPDEAKAACNGPANGEILGGWDGGGDIPGLMGWEINEKGLVCSDAYRGWAFRSGVGLYFEYDLGEQTVGPWHWFYLWVNRRVAPYDEANPANDPDAR